MGVVWGLGSLIGIARLFNMIMIMCTLTCYSHLKIFLINANKSFNVPVYILVRVGFFFGGGGGGGGMMYQLQ